MAKVYFLEDFSKLNDKTKKLLKDFYLSNSEVMVKIHFGEPGNKFAFTADDIQPIIKAMNFLKLKPVFIDTPVAYHSPRNSIKGYEEVVRKRGYDKLAPFIISNNSIKFKTKNFTAEVCKELVKAKNVLVVSHIKGHACAGFGGAVKNLGMGGVSKGTKNIEHNLGKPKFISECEGCGICADICPSGAIKMINGKAKINLNDCCGCSICQIKCPYKCLAPLEAYFDDLLAQGASAVISNLPLKTFYINFVKNITKFCDCKKNPGKLISKDIGVLFSKNPIAIDKASVDLINKFNGKDVFQEINHKDPLSHLKFASEYAKKELEYELIAI